MFIKGPRSKHFQNAMGRGLEVRSHGPVTQRGLRSRKKKKKLRILWMLTNQSHSKFWRMMILALLRWYDTYVAASFSFAFQVKIFNVTTFNVGFYFCHQGPISASIYLFVNGSQTQNQPWYEYAPCFRFYIDLIIILQGFHLLGMEGNSASVQAVYARRSSNIQKGPSHVYQYSSESHRGQKQFYSNKQAMIMFQMTYSPIKGFSRPLARADGDTGQYKCFYSRYDLELKKTILLYLIKLSVFGFQGSWQEWDAGHQHYSKS